MKNLISTLFIAGELVFNSCGNNPKKEFKVYNPDTKEIYYVKDSLYAKKLQEEYDSIHKIDSIESIESDFQKYDREQYNKIRDSIEDIY
ncbi:MAG: hypothetical protein AABX44_02000 [Nanoarchaeota archaeon]